MATNLRSAHVRLETGPLGGAPPRRRTADRLSSHSAATRTQARPAPARAVPGPRLDGHSAFLLADYGSRLCWASPGGKPGATEKHAAFKALVQRCAERPATRRVGRRRLPVYCTTPPRRCRRSRWYDRCRPVTFQVGDDWPTENPDVQAFWANRPGPNREQGQHSSVPGDGPDWAGRVQPARNAQAHSRRPVRPASLSSRQTLSRLSPMAGSAPRPRRSRARRRNGSPRP